MQHFAFHESIRERLEAVVIDGAHEDRENECQMDVSNTFRVLVKYESGMTFATAPNRPYAKPPSLDACCKYKMDRFDL
jgi:hypothetical protein